MFVLLDQPEETHTNSLDAWISALYWRRNLFSKKWTHHVLFLFFYTAVFNLGGISFLLLWAVHTKSLRVHVVRQQRTDVEYYVVHLTFGKCRGIRYILSGMPSHFRLMKLNYVCIQPKYKPHVFFQRWVFSNLLPKRNAA